MFGSTFGSTPILVGVVLTSLCLAATGGEFLLDVLLAGLVVPIATRTYLILARRRAAGEPISLLASLGTLLACAVHTVAFSLWLMVVILITVILKASDLDGLVALALIGPTIWLMIMLVERGTAYVAKLLATKPDWRRLCRVRLSVRGMLIGVAFVAFALWPVHRWRMRPTYAAVASYEGFVAGLCENESRRMAERAVQCRERASEGAAWDLDDGVSEDLKVCPHSNDAPGHSWGEQAGIWERAAERSRKAFERHRANSARYEPWFGPSRRR